MSTNNSNRTGGGISFLGALALVFIVLKLTEVIDWSWWWVLGPLWIPTVVLIVVACIIAGVWVPVWLAKKRKAKRRVKQAVDRRTEWQKSHRGLSRPAHMPPGYPE